MNCLFCKIAKREIPADVVYEDSHLVAFRDIRPVAPTHVLLIPRQHVSSLAETTESYTQTLGLLLAGSAHVAAQLGLAADEYSPSAHLLNLSVIIPFTR